MILKISTVLMLGVFPLAKADRVQKRKIEKREVRELTDTEHGGVSISASNRNGEGAVKYQGKEVWKGKVRDQLHALAETVNGEDVAAAFDGKRLVWENRKGDGAKLRPKLRAQLDALEKLKP